MVMHEGQDFFVPGGRKTPPGRWGNNTNVDECYQTYKTLTNKHDRMIFHISANRIIMHKSA